MAKQSPQQALPNEEAMYSVYQVADQLGVNAETVRRWIRKEELAALLFPGTIGYRVRSSALQDFLARQELRAALNHQLAQAS